MLVVSDQDRSGVFDPLWSGQLPKAVTRARREDRKPDWGRLL